MKNFFKLFIAFTLFLSGLPGYCQGGYVPGESSRTEVDPVYSASDAADVTSAKITNWDTAYGWGDHSTEGYLKVESDPVFTASDVFAVTSTDISNWNAKLDAESDPVFSADSTVTKQGNSFNGASQLVQMTAATKLPAVDGSNLTNLPGGDTFNIETLSADKTLTTSDANYQLLNPNGNNRNVYLPTSGIPTGKRFYIMNTASMGTAYALKVYWSGGGTIDDVQPGNIQGWIFNGGNPAAMNWVTLTYNTYGYGGFGQGVGIGAYSIANGYGAGLGSYATAKNYGACIGYACKAYDYSFAGGAYATADGATGTNLFNNVVGGGDASGATSAQSTKGATVAAGKSYNGLIGQDTYANADYTIVIGRSAKTNKDHQKALGAWSAPIRYGEFRYLNLGNSGTTPFRNDTSASSFLYFKDTTNATPAEPTLNNSIERLTLAANSAMYFKAMISARDYTTGDSASWEYKGLIKRDGSNNTTLSDAVKTIIHKDDASWDISFTADDTNESLKPMVTGDASNSCRWAIKVDVVETSF